MNRRIGTLVAVAGVVFVAAAALVVYRVTDARAALDAPGHSPNSLVWLGDGYIYYLASSSGDSGAVMSLWKVAADGRESGRQVNLALPGCPRPQPDDLFRASETEIGILALCEEQAEPAVYSFAPATSESRRLSDARDAFAVGGLLADSGRPVGVSNACAPAIIVFPVGADCANAIGGSAPYTVNAATIYFTCTAVDFGGQGSICAKDGVSAPTRTLVESLPKPLGLAVDPVRGRVAVATAEGLYLVGSSSAKNEPVRKGVFTGVAMSPDGERLVAIEQRQVGMLDGSRFVIVEL